MFGYDFANPQYFWLLLVIIPMVVWYILRQKSSEADLQYSSLSLFKGVKKAGYVWMRHLLFVLRIVSIIFLCIALARPQSKHKWEEYNSEGIDIALALDVSSSMLAQDFEPNRLEAAKTVAQEFILERPEDRIGLVVFSGESFTQSPLTTDHSILINLMKGVQSGMIEDGTAIGLGLANAVNRLKDSDAKSKVVILLTDGVNNQGVIAPLTAAELAKSYGIRVYTIGVGSYGEAPYPVQTPFGAQVQMMPVEIDEAVLQEIADLTDGKYFRATDNESLQKIYEDIDQLEKTKMEVKHFSKKQEQYFIFALLGLLFVIAEALLRYTVLRKIP